MKLESGFFKVQPLNTSNHMLDEKCRFIWVDEPTEKRLNYISFSLGSKFYDGCELIPVDYSDDNFKEYINKDLEKVQSDIDKLLVLKERLLKAKSGLNQ